VKKIARPTADLAQARSLRSGERGPLAQATSPRLGEITTETLGGFSHARLGEPTPRLGCNCSDTRRAPTRSRLGEHLSLERDSTSLKTKALRLSESSSAS